MRKTIFSAVIGLSLVWALGAQAQLAFWNYDDGDIESQIPAECDGQLDEERGGVFMPTAEEMRIKGEEFLLNENPVERNKAGYCLIGAALRGDVLAQFRVAQLYNKGVVLPQDELSAYRWAFIASMNGHPEAEGLALLLERFLTTKDIELATASIQSLSPEISARYRRELDEQMAKVAEKQQTLDEINAEIDKILGIDKVVLKGARNKPDTSLVLPTEDIFTESDLF